jgi:cysteine desulfurase
MREAWENPSSAHRPGQNARAKLELARKSIADLIGAKPREIVFASSGTESVHLAILGTLDALPESDLPPLVVSDKVEHSAVRELLAALEARGRVRVRWLTVNTAGVVQLDSLRDALEHKPALVSVQWANNETGVIQPVFEIAALCQAAGVPFHCDSVQWAGKELTRIGAPDPSAPADAEAPALHATLLSLSPHKFHGLKGVGCLYVRRGAKLRPLTPGNQELGRRGGTENVPGILAAGAAADAAIRWLADPLPRRRLAALRDRFEAQVLAACPGAVINGAGAQRLWNTTNISFPRLEAEAILLALSERGLCASAGAACASGSLEPSPVLLAMGVGPEVAHGSVRFSLSRETSASELEEAASVVARCVLALRESTGAVV